MHEAIQQIQEPDNPRFPQRSSQEKARYHVPLRAADMARSANNIALWNSYLTAACVRTMVRMGWDYTT